MIQLHIRTTFLMVGAVCSALAFFRIYSECQSNVDNVMDLKSELKDV